MFYERLIFTKLHETGKVQMTDFDSLSYFRNI